MKNYYRTIIIGGGPAGLTAGRYLENALILDKKNNIGKPVQCGEGMNRKALERQGINPARSWVSCNIHKLERIAPSGVSMGRFESSPKGYILDRGKFEKFLLSRCRAEIKLGEKVVSLEKEDKRWKITTENGVFYSDYVIAADGPLSLVRQKFFPDTGKELGYFSAIEYLVETEEEMDTRIAQFYLDNEFYDQGYGWIFPKGKRVANVGIGGRKIKWNDFEVFLREKVEKRYGKFKLIENRSGTVPSGGFRGKLYRNGLMLTGDAGGLADPIFDGGMTQAMESARIASECILNNEAELYEEKVKVEPFADPQLLEIKEIFFSLDNQVLNHLAQVLNGRSSSYLKSFPGIFKLLSNSVLRKKLKELYKFFSVWKRVKDHLW